jgi:hypothetical protein
LANLIKWEVETKFLAKTPEERLKMQVQMQKWVKEDVEKGIHTAWGMDLGGMSGIALTNLDGEDLYLAMMRFSPLIKFKVKRMLTIDEAIDATQKLVKMRE